MAISSTAPRTFESVGSYDNGTTQCRIWLVGDEPLMPLAVESSSMTGGMELFAQSAAQRGILKRAGDLNKIAAAIADDLFSQIGGGWHVVVADTHITSSMTMDIRGLNTLRLANPEWQIVIVQVRRNRFWIKIKTGIGWGGIQIGSDSEWVGSVLRSRDESINPHWFCLHLIDAAP